MEVFNFTRLKVLILVLGLILSAILAVANNSVHDRGGVRVGAGRAGIGRIAVSAAAGGRLGWKFAAGGGMNAVSAEAAAAEVRMVIREADNIYGRMGLDSSGLGEEAFEYAWRGYHNLLKKGLIRKKTVLSICDFSQSSCSKRLYVIDVKHKKLLYRTYVAHGKNSGDEYASSFSNDPESFKSSLGFYVTKRTYYGKNGLSLRIEGVDSGFNDQAGKRNIVLHGSGYVGDKYLQDNGIMGTSLGCPAIPSHMSRRIIRSVRNGSCFFIYHPTEEYLLTSGVING